MRGAAFFKMLDETRLVRRLALLWWMAMATGTLIWAVHQSPLTEQVVGVLDIVFGVSGVVFGLYTAGRVVHETRRAWRRHGPDNPDDMVG